MKRHLPPSRVAPGHPDHPLLAELAEDILARAKGADQLANKFAMLLRDCIDDVIMTPKTGRRGYDELEKTEKTYIGTRVEIELRALLQLPKGRLDTVIRGHDVDIKHTMGSNWMIPTEAVDAPCLLVAADETRARCYLGLVVARTAHLTHGQNKDAKRSLNADSFADILWLVCAAPYPRNFWATVPGDAVERIFSAPTGNARVVTLFQEVQRRPIDRSVVEAVARQRDFMRRIRADKGRGARDILAARGIVLLSGQYDAALMAALRLPQIDRSAFMSFRPGSPTERAVIAQAGWTLGSDHTPEQSSIDGKLL